MWNDISKEEYDWIMGNATGDDAVDASAFWFSGGGYFGHAAARKAWVDEADAIGKRKQRQNPAPVVVNAEFVDLVDEGKWLT